MRITVLSRAQAEEYEPGDNEACISISCPVDGPARLSPHFKAVLRLWFDDVDGRVLAAWGDDGGIVYFNEQMAEDILAFADEHRDKDLVVHCWAGISRSTAVALSLMETEGPVPAPIEKLYPNHNRFVRRIMGEVARRRKAA